MSGNTGKYQIVFLIDLHTCVPEDENDTSVDRIGPCISLCALRILTLLSGHADVPNKQPNVRWGFKFYNSVTRRFQRYSLKDFTREEFDKFEAEVESVIESEREKCHGLLRKRRKVEAEDVDNHSGRKLGEEEEVDPVEQLQGALRDIVSDFQWDVPDITSPVKTHISKRFRHSAGRNKQPLDCEETYQYNLTFLLSKCPCSSADLARFVGMDRKIKPNEALSSFMPTAIYRQFSDMARIRLFWIDLNVEYTSTDANPTCGQDISGLTTMHEALSSVRGGVLPLSSIIQSGSLSTASIHSLVKHKESTKPTVKDGEGSKVMDAVCSKLILPHSILLKWSLNNILRESIELPQEFRGVLVKQEGENFHTVCDIDVHAMTKPQPKETNSTRLSFSTRNALSKPHSWSLEKNPKEPTSSNLPESSRKFVFTESDEEERTQKRESVEESVRNLCIRGTVKIGDLPLHSLDSSCVYFVKKTAAQNGTLNFSHLLSQLAAHHLVLVILCENGMSSLLGVLQSLTCDLATLTFVKSDMVLSVEKEILFHKKTNETCASLSQFVSEHVERLCNQVKGHELVKAESKGPSHPIPQASLTFESTFMEPWFTSSTTGDVTDKLILSLLDSENDEKVEAAEVSALQAMQKLYHEEMYGCPTSKAKSTPRKRSSPRKSNRRTPRKAVRGTPNKKLRRTPSKSLRRTPSKNLRRTPSKALRRTPRKTPRKTPNKAGRQIGKSFCRRRSAPALSKSRSFTAPLGRTAVIIQKSQQVAAQNIDEEDEEDEISSRGATGSKPENTAPQMSDKDFQNEGELVEHVKKYLESYFAGDMQCVTCVQTIVNVTLHYMKSTDTENPEKSAEALIRNNLILTTKEIKEKYKGGEENVEACLSEYQVQIVLYMELESLLMIHGRSEEEQEQAVREVASMLTRITLLKDNTYAGAYMKDTLLDNYVETIPKLVGNVYQELMLPLPPQLESLFSGSDDDDDEAADTPSSVQVPSVLSDLGSVSRPSWSPATRRTMRNRRSVVSIANINMGKNRQIAVPAKAKPKDQRKNQKKQKKPTRPASAKKTKDADAAKSEVKLVRRNLFTGSPVKGKSRLERHKSASVMEGASRQPKTPSKTPKKRIVPQAQKTPKSHHVIKTREVQETPAHKQVEKGMLRRIEKERRRGHIVTDVDVIEESPNKLPTKDKPSLSRRVSMASMRNASFYSAGAERESRNVQRYMQLEARMTNQNPLTSPNSKTTVKISPPRRIQPVNLFAHLSSPSPQKMPRRLAPSSCSAVRSLRNFDMDSPSKNTRTRSLFAPPEVDPQSAADPVHHFAAVGFGSPLRQAKGSSSPRRVVLRGPLFSPQRKPTVPSPLFMSPVKAIPLLQTPEKSNPRIIPQSLTPEHCAIGSPMTPRRSKRLTSPNSTGWADLRKTPEKNTTQNSSPSKINRIPNLLSPVKFNTLPITPKKNIALEQGTSGLLTPSKDDRQNVVENWARKALRHTPQRAARAEGLFSPTKDRLLNPPAVATPKKSARRSLMGGESQEVGSRHHTNSHIDILSPRRSSRLSRFSPTSTQTMGEASISGQEGIGIRPYTSPPESKSNVETTPTRCNQNEDDKSEFTPPHTKPQKRAGATPPSRRVKGGRTTPEGPSHVDQGHRKKTRSSILNPKLDIQNNQFMERKCNEPKSGGSKVVSSQGRKRTFSNTQEDENDDEVVLGTPLKRRRTGRTSLSKLSSSRGADSSMDYFESSEVFIESTSTVGSTKENSPREDKNNSLFSPKKRTMQKRGLSQNLFSKNRMLRGSGTDSDSNIEPQFSGATNTFVRNDSNVSDLSPQKASGSAQIMGMMSPSKGHVDSPSTAGRKYSPSISTMSLAHLMQSPLLEGSPSSKSGTSTRSRVNQGVTSRRSLYKTE